MYKNQLQELAQRSCFNLPAYSCIREGPDHAPRFKATVNFNGETFESPTFCSTLRQAEHAAAEIALNTLAKRGPYRALAARVLDETGIYKNLLQETAHRAGLNLPVYTTIRSGPGHVPIFSCTVEIAGMNFAGDPARTKKQAQKNAAMAAWLALRKLSQHHLSSATSSSFPSVSKGNEEQEQVIIARVLASLEPSKSKNFSEIDHQHRWQSYPTTSLESSLPKPGMYPMQFQSCGPSGFSPDVAMYQIWQHEQIIQQQNPLFALAIAPPISSTPQIYPLMQPMLHSDYCLYFPDRGLVSVPVGPRFTIGTSSPSMYITNHIVPDSNKSAVIIREIHEEKAEHSSEFSQSAVSDLPLCNLSKRRALRPVQVDDKQSQGVSESSNHWSIDSVYRPVNIELQNPSSIHSFHPILSAQPKANVNQSFRPPSSAPSTVIRTLGLASCEGSRPQHGEPPMAVSSRMRSRVPRTAPAVPTSIRFDMVGAPPPPPPLSVAPPVRIRSVVPVCSAPPRRAVHEMSKTNEKKELQQKQEEEDVSRATSGLGNLRI